MFGFSEFEEKYGKNTKPAFLKAMMEARAAISGAKADNNEPGEGGDKRRSSRVSKKENPIPIAFKIMLLMGQVTITQINVRNIVWRLVGFSFQRV